MTTACVIEDEKFTCSGKSCDNRRFVPGKMLFTRNNWHPSCEFFNGECTCDSAKDEAAATAVRIGSQHLVERINARVKERSQ